MKKYNIFISYSPEDSIQAQQIANKLKNKNFTCFIPSKDNSPNVEWSNGIMNAINDSDIFLICFSKNAAASKQISRELELAGNTKELLLISVRLDSTEVTGRFKYYLSSCQWISKKKNGKQIDYHQLYQAINEYLGKKYNYDPKVKEKKKKIIAGVGASLLVISGIVTAVKINDPPDSVIPKMIANTSDTEIAAAETPPLSETAAAISSEIITEQTTISTAESVKETTTIPQNSLSDTELQQAITDNKQFLLERVESCLGSDYSYYPEYDRYGLDNYWNNIYSLVWYGSSYGGIESYPGIGDGFLLTVTKDTLTAWSHVLYANFTAIPTLPADTTTEFKDNKYVFQGGSSPGDTLEGKWISVKKGTDNTFVATIEAYDYDKLYGTYSFILVRNEHYDPERIWDLPFSIKDIEFDKNENYPAANSTTATTSSSTQTYCYTDDDKITVEGTIRKEYNDVAGEYCYVIYLDEPILFRYNDDFMYFYNPYYDPYSDNATEYISVLQLYMIDAEAYVDHHVLLESTIRTKTVGWTDWTTYYTSAILYGDSTVYRDDSVNNTGSWYACLEVTGNSANVRSTPDKTISTNILGQVTKGQIYYAYSYDGYWYCIDYNGKIGYLSHKMVKEVSY